MGAPNALGSSKMSTSGMNHHHHHYNSTSARDESNDLNKPTAGDCSSTMSSLGGNPTLGTYLSLVQQYLSVFMIDNAIFLVERCLAEYPYSSEAVYLHALCFYREGNPKRCRAILDRHHMDSSTKASSGNSGSTLGSLGLNRTLTTQVSESTGIGSGSDIRSSMLYLSAQCSMELGDHSRAEETLLKEARSVYRQHQGGASGGVLSSQGHMTMDDWIVQTTPCPIPNGAAGVALLGKICRKSNRKEQAIKYFKMSLQLDPFIWTSFAALAELDAPNVDPSKIFGVTSTSTGAVGATTTDKNSFGFLTESKKATKTPLQPMETPAASTTHAHSNSLFANQHQNSFHHNHHSVGRSNLQPNNMTALQTPGLTPIPVNTSSRSFMMHAESATPMNYERNMSTVTSTQTPQEQNHQRAVPPGDPMVLRRACQVATRQYYPPSPDTPGPPPSSGLASVTKSMRYLRGLGNTQNVLGQNKSSLLGGGRSTSTENQASNLAAPASASKKEEEGVQKPEASQTLNKDTSAAASKVLELLSVTGAAYQHLCRYQCREALSVMSHSLSRRQQLTAWALHLQGRAHLYLNDFSSAQRCLEHMQSQEPGRLQGLELLSTVYWQLKKETELAHLAQRVVDWSRLSPESWCVVGNCFSLQKDHESALMFFQRSLQIDPDFTYSHTLSGYEYMANDDFDKATACFRQALRTDERHYNAWYGLGAIYHRQEKFDLAEYHFTRAVSIHPTSSVLRCNLGVAQYANGKAYIALDTLSEAFRLNPRNPQARFQRATIYSALQRPEDALVELERVRDAAPREAAVHFAMGKVLKKLGRQEQAMKSFLTAMDLDPKDNQLIKAAMDKLDEPDIDDESMAAF